MSEPNGSDLVTQDHAWVHIFESAIESFSLGPDFPTPLTSGGRKPSAVEPQHATYIAI